MLDTLIVVAIVAIAAFFVGRNLYKQYTAKEPGCACSGCGQSGSCSSIQSSPTGSDCSSSK